MGFRIGLLGPLDGDLDLLREAVDYLLRSLRVDRAIYLGEDTSAVREFVAQRRRSLLGEPPDVSFLRQAAEQASEGSASTIRALLGREAEARRLSAIHLLPRPPGKAIELVGDRMILMAHELSAFDEEDLVNASLLVYGASPVAELRRSNTRYFLTPGPLEHGRVALIERETKKRVAIGLYATSGSPIWRETLRNPSHKLVAR